MTDYSDHAQVINALKKDQNAEEDLRKEIDAVIDFVHKPNGQWEREIWAMYDGRPRYTFDQQKPEISAIWGEMAANEYNAVTQPVGDGASQEVSNILNGLLRNSYEQGCFDDISTKAGKRMIMTGLGGWRLVAKYADGDSIYQDILPEGIPDFHRRVWFEAGSEMQTREDAMHVHVLSKITFAEAKRRWPDKQIASVDDERKQAHRAYKPEDLVTVGEILYKERATKDIYLIDEDGTVVDKEGLKARGLKPQDAIASREGAEYFKVKSRKYDAIQWLNDEKDTAFNMLPVIPIYAHFDVTDGKVTYEGVVRSRMDAQRVLNYAESRKVENEILAPPEKLLADDRAVEGYEDDFGKINRDPRHVMRFNGAKADEIKHGFGPFQTVGGARPSPALTELTQNMTLNMQLSSGRQNNVETARIKQDSDFRASQRDSMGQVGNFEYYRGLKVGLEHTAKVYLGAVPRIYDTKRKVRIIDDAKVSKEVVINDKDAKGQDVNNLLSGRYHISFKIGKDMESRKSDANDGILELAKYDETVAQRNSDIIARNISAPGMDLVADRERSKNMQAGVIPEDQWTDEEKEQAAIAQQQAQQQTDPMAEMAAAEMQKAQNEAQKIQIDALIKQADLERKELELQQKQQKMEFESQMQAIKLAKEQDSQEIEDLKKLAETLKTLVEATGADAVVGPEMVQGIAQQAELVTEGQQNI